ncbi:MAG: Bordetella phage vB BbrM, partial [Acidobacteriota bacterium]
MSICLDRDGVTIHNGDCLEVLRTMPDESVQCCVTSPPYWGLRDYGHDGQIGLESTPEAYVGRMVEVFREVRRVLREDGTLWLNLGDSYANKGAKDSSAVGGFTGERIRAGAKGIMDSRPREIPDGLKPKDLVGIPWRVAFALQADGWYLRQDIIWHKPNPMPESVTDRCTKAHEYVFLMAKSQRYYYDA